MADCATCGRALGGQRRRCRTCGACEGCCGCDADDFRPFSPAELGLDPEDYDLNLWNTQRRRGGNGRIRPGEPDTPLELDELDDLED